MNRVDLNLIVEWAAQEGWNPGLHDADCFWAADPQGFWMGILDGEPIGCISAVRYSMTFGFIGFYIVLPPYRGQGYGIRLWEQAMAYLSGGTIGLDGVIAQQANYQKSGFKKAYRHIRYQYLGPALDTFTSGNVIPLRLIPFETLSQFDRTVFPAPRDAFLRCWIHKPNSRAIAYTEQDQLLGYGVIRPSHQGYRIGPLFASDSLVADTLFIHLLGGVDPGAGVCIDVPDLNAEAIALVERYGMKPIFEAARMYTDTLPDSALHQVFGITSLELG